MFILCWFMLICVDFAPKTLTVQHFFDVFFYFHVSTYSPTGNQYLLFEKLKIQRHYNTFWGFRFLQNSAGGSKFWNFVYGLVSRVDNFEKPVHF